MRSGRGRRKVRLLPLAALLLLAAAAAWPVTAAPQATLALAAPAATAAPGGQNQAALVVRYPDGGVKTACVSFPETTISGEQLMGRAGLAVTMNINAGMGGAMCSINGLGCAYPKQDCFCKCMGAQCEYWAYYHQAAGIWQYSQVGASTYQVADGAVEGWSWGPGNFVSGTEPPAVAFDDVCGDVRQTASSVPNGDSTGRPAPGGTVFAGSLVQYGVYLALAAALVGAAGWVLRRRARG